MDQNLYLLNSVLAPDEDIRKKAKSVQILLEFDHILGSRGNRLATARGRAYHEGKVDVVHYHTLNLFKNLPDEYVLETNVFDPRPITNQSTNLKRGSLFLVMVSVRTYVRNKINRSKN